MRVSELMTRDPKTCHVADNLDAAARLMWVNDCGFVPVVDDDRHAVGVITDRDICMAARLARCGLEAIGVRSAMTPTVFAVAPSDKLVHAGEIMAARQVRRVVVLDTERHVVGVLSLDDLARFAARPGRHDGLSRSALALMFGRVCEPREALADWEAE